MKKLNVHLCSIFIGFFSVYSCAATNLENVTITALEVNKTQGNNLYIRTSIAPTLAGCQTNSDWNLVLPLGSDLSSKVYEALAAAKDSHSKLILSGAGTCDPSGVEMFSTFTLVQ